VSAPPDAAGPSRELGRRAAELVARAPRRGEVEAFEKRGRSRRYEIGAQGELSSTAVEAGWAVRWGDRQRSGFSCGTGELPRVLPEGATSGHPLRLPEPTPVPPWTPPPGLAAPLAGESEARALVESIGRELARELPGSRLVGARFEEGTSESALASSLGVRARTLARAATLRLEAVHEGLRVSSESWALEAREINPLAQARRVADRLAALGGRIRPRARSLLLAPPLAARLIEALAPSLAGREAPARVAAWAGRRAALGSETVRIVDDGALAGGLLAAAADGEGFPCGEAVLVESGRFVRPLVAWWEAESPEQAAGCARRASWRDLPRRAPTHFYLAGDPSVSVRDLLAEADVYLIDAEGGVAVDSSSGRFAVPVSGFALQGGRAAGGLGLCRLTGALGDWLRGVRAAARDRGFVAGDGMFGAPTLLVSGSLELAAAGA
jgi:predicted Zn-dependent protease